MRRRAIAGGALVAAVAAGVLGAGTVIGSGSEPRPGYATVDVPMELAGGQPNARAQSARAKAKKAKVIYLESAQPSTIDVTPSPPGTGPYVDVRLFSCPGNSKVIDGGVVPLDTNVYQQGSYIPESKKEYHVLLGFDDEAVAGGQAIDFQITSHLVCLKGVK